MFFPDVWNEIETHPGHVELKVKYHPDEKYHEIVRSTWMEDLKNEPSGKVILVGGHSKSFRELVKEYGNKKSIPQENIVKTVNYDVYGKYKLFNTELVYAKIEFKGQKMQITAVTNVYRPDGELRTGSKQTV